MPRGKPKEKKPEKKPILQYDHKDKTRCNNPPVGLVRPETDPDLGKKIYQYDPHLDPQLQWAGKAEHTSFDIDTISLHVHERIDPRTIIEAVRKRNGTTRQISLFEFAEENPPIREAIEFYKHKHGWSNRLIAGDSLLVMNSLLEKEGMAGKVQMIYIDPPYGISYNTNFQPFLQQISISSSDKDEDLTSEPEMLKAFRDTWELGIHSYLTYIRDRVKLCHQLLSEKGSIFIQISDENLHRVRSILDELFGANNFVSIISVKKASVMFQKKLLNNAVYYIIWYAKEKEKITYNQLYRIRNEQDFADVVGSHLWIEDKISKAERKVTSDERKNIKFLLDNNSNYRLFGTWSLNAQGTEKRNPIEFQGKQYYPPKNTQWKTSYEGIETLKKKNRLVVESSTLRFKIYYDDAPVVSINNLWEQIGAPSEKIYVVQTPNEIIKRCILMTSHPGDLILDITCGSGTTAFVSEQYGRRWITCDTSRVAVTLAKQRLMTSIFDYYELQHPDEGVASGFNYKTVPSVTLTSITNYESPAKETLYDQPIPDNTRIRVTGPFTVEAVPSPTVKPLTEVEIEIPADESVSRSGETLRQSEWRDELLRTGIRGKGGQKIEFFRVEPLAGTRWLHAEAATKEDTPQRVVLSFGPEHAPLEQRQVALALEEAQKLIPKPTIILFVAFQFDPEAAKDIDETKWTGVNLLKVQMNADLFTNDLKKKRVSNESFWLIGQPDVQVNAVKEGKDKGKYSVEVLGFDYYDTKNGTVVSGGAHNIAVWMLDTDYDGRSLYPRQVFFPMADEKSGWVRLAKNLKAEIDENLIESYRGTKSLPFELGDFKRVAVKIVDDRGIESLKIIEVD